MNVTLVSISPVPTRPIPSLFLFLSSFPFPFDISDTLNITFPSLVDKVDAKKMQDQAAHDKIGKGAFGRDRGEIALVGLGSLDAKGSFCRISLASSLFGRGRAGESIPVRTNWPTVAEKPERKALNGYHRHIISLPLSERGKGKRHLT